MTKILLGTTSEEKVAQYKEILKELGYRKQDVQLVSLAEVCGDNPPIEVREDGYTFEENAVQKAISYGRRYIMPCIADDSGLVVTALNGLPGVHSHRDVWDSAKVLKALSPSAPRDAKLHCSMAFYDPSKDAFLLRSWYIGGEIVQRADRGKAYGYDGIFQGYANTKPISTYLRSERLDGRKWTRVRLGYPRAICLEQIMNNITNGGAYIKA